MNRVQSSLCQVSKDIWKEPDQKNLHEEYLSLA